MHKLIFIPLLVIFLTSCKNEPSLIGHWHAEIIYPTKNGVPSSSVFTFDILNDTLLSVWNNPPFWEGQPGYHDSNAQTFRFGVECLTTAWGYKIESADQLSAADLRTDFAKQITLSRKNDCSVESHLFLDSRLSISLPEARPGTVQLAEPALQRNYTIGPANEDYEGLYPGHYRYQLGDKIITKQDTGFFELYEWQHLVKIPENKRHLCKSIVYANAATNSTALNAILEYSYTKGNDTLYFAMINKEHDNTSLCYLPIPVLSSAGNEKLNVEEWLALETNNQ